MLYVRDDDVLLPSSSYPDAFGRFRQVHDWIRQAEGKIIHRPAILVTEIQAFPDCIEYIREKTKAGEMEPEIHGLEHIDYGKLTKTQVKEHLTICRDFILDKFEFNASRWYTPWGASQAHLHEVADNMGITLVDCSQINKMRGKHGVCQRLKEGTPIELFDGQEIFTHWWEGGSRLLRICLAMKHGSWAAAAKVEHRLFK